MCVFWGFGVESSFSLLCLSSGPDFRGWERWRKSSDCSLPSAPVWWSKRRQLSQERSWGGSRDEERDSATGLCPPHGPTETLRRYKKSFLETLLRANPSQQAEKQDWKNDRLSSFCTEKIFFPHPHISQQNLKTINRGKEGELEFVIEAQSWKRWRFDTDTEKLDNSSVRGGIRTNQNRR